MSSGIFDGFWSSVSHVLRGPLTLVEDGVSAVEGRVHRRLAAVEHGIDERVESVEHRVAAVEAHLQRKLKVKLEKLAILVGLGIAAAACIVLGGAFLIVAVWLQVDRWTGPVWASAAVGGFFVFASVLFAVFTLRTARTPARTA